MPEVDGAGIALIAGVIVLAAAALCAALILLLRPLFLRYALARPNARSLHSTPTPQGGGVAVVTATFAVGLAAILLSSAAAGTGLPPVLLLLAAAVLLAVIGAIDDIRPLAAGPRLLLQLGAVALVVTALPHDLRVVEALPLWLERGLVVIAGLWFVNLVNFMDGMDWMTVAEAVPVTAGLIVLGALGALPPAAVLLALALLGALLGFAPFNKPVARLFLGDAGSLPLGLMLGWLLLILAANGQLAAALILPLYYLADATITLFRRLFAGERIWQAHRTHYYQRATQHGLTVPAIIGRVFALNCALVAMAAVTVLSDSLAIDLAMLALAGALVAWLLIGFARGS